MLRAVNVTSGLRTIDMRGSLLQRAERGNAVYRVVLRRGRRWDHRRELEPVTTKPAGMGVAPFASDDALLWFDLSTNPRNVVLYRPR